MLVRHCRRAGCGDNPTASMLNGVKTPASELCLHYLDSAVCHSLGRYTYTTWLPRLRMPQNSPVLISKTQQGSQSFPQLAASRQKLWQAICYPAAGFNSTAANCGAACAPPTPTATQPTYVHISCSAVMLSQPRVSRKLYRNMCHPRTTHSQLAHHVHGALAEVECNRDLVFAQIIILQQ